VIKVSVIIPTWKRVNILRNVINALNFQDFPKENFEVLICDSQSNDGTLELVENFKHENSLNILLINSEINAQSVKRNDGAQKAKGNILIFLDDDVIPNNNLIKNYYNAQKKENNTVFLGLSLFSLNKLKISNFIRYRNHRSKMIQRYKNEIPPQNFVSMNFSIKKTDFIKIGMFDPIFTNYGGEDHDFPIRMAKMGYCSKLLRGAESEHREPNPNLLNRMKKIFISAQKGFVPLKIKFPSFFHNSKLGLLERNFPEDSKIRIGEKTLVKYFLNSRFIKLICYYLVWSDHYRLLYMPILYKIVFAYAYFNGVSKRSSNDDFSADFIDWKFWEKFNQN